jgi:hypothetical protein
MYVLPRGKLVSENWKTLLEFSKNVLKSNNSLILRNARENIEKSPLLAVL